MVQDAAEEPLLATEKGLPANRELYLRQKLQPPLVEIMEKVRLRLSPAFGLCVCVAWPSLSWRKQMAACSVQVLTISPQPAAAEPLCWLLLEASCRMVPTATSASCSLIILLAASNSIAKCCPLQLLLLAAMPLAVLQSGVLHYGLRYATVLRLRYRNYDKFTDGRKLR
jgi:hypothetical protein